MKYPSSSICFLVVGCFCSSSAKIKDTVLVERNWNEVSKQIETVLEGTSDLTESDVRLKRWFAVEGLESA